MQVGDLVRHTISKSLGLGLVTHIATGTCGVKVLWSVNGSPTAEISDMLEIVSETR